MSSNFPLPHTQNPPPRGALVCPSCLGDWVSVVWEDGMDVYECGRCGWSMDVPAGADGSVEHEACRRV
ncbi:MAG: hypothetical protein ABEN55_13360 [Bradymonadaceae bacterium]